MCDPVQGPDTALFPMKAIEHSSQKSISLLFLHASALKVLRNVPNGHNCPLRTAPLETANLRNENYDMTDCSL